MISVVMISSANMTINKANVAAVDRASEPEWTISAEGDPVFLNGDYIASFESEHQEPQKCD